MDEDNIIDFMAKPEEENPEMMITVRHLENDTVVETVERGFGVFIGGFYAICSTPMASNQADIRVMIPMGSITFVEQSELPSVN